MIVADWRLKPRAQRCVACGRPFAPGGVTLRVKGGEVRVEGEGLFVAQYGGGDLLLRGDVRRIEFCGGGA